MALAHAVLVTAKQANSRTYLLDSPAETETAHRHLLRYTAVCHYALVFGAVGCTIRYRASSPHQRQAASLILFYLFSFFLHAPSFIRRNLPPSLSHSSLSAPPYRQLHSSCLIIILIKRPVLYYISSKKENML